MGAQLGRILRSAPGQAIPDNTSKNSKTTQGNTTVQPAIEKEIKKDYSKTVAPNRISTTQNGERWISRSIGIREDSRNDFTFR